MHADCTQTVLHQDSALECGVIQPYVLNGICLSRYHWNNFSSVRTSCMVGEDATPEWVYRATVDITLIFVCIQHMSTSEWVVSISSCDQYNLNINMLTRSYRSKLDTYNLFRRRQFFTDPTHMPSPPGYIGRKMIDTTPLNAGLEPIYLAVTKHPIMHVAKIILRLYRS